MQCCALSSFGELQAKQLIILLSQERGAPLFSAESVAPHCHKAQRHASLLSTLTWGCGERLLEEETIELEGEALG